MPRAPWREPWGMMAWPHVLQYCYGAVTFPGASNLESLAGTPLLYAPNPGAWQIPDTLNEKTLIALTITGNVVGRAKPKGVRFILEKSMC